MFAMAPIGFEKQNYAVKKDEKKLSCITACITYLFFQYITCTI